MCIFGHFRDFGDILVILEVSWVIWAILEFSWVFWSFWRFQVYFSGFWGNLVILGLPRVFVVQGWF